MESAALWPVCLSLMERQTGREDEEDEEDKVEISTGKTSVTTLFFSYQREVYISVLASLASWLLHVCQSLHICQQLVIGFGSFLFLRGLNLLNAVYYR